MEVYAPKLNAAEEAKGSFCDDLEDAVGRVPQETCWLSQGTGTQDPVPWTRQHGMFWVGLQLARNALMVTACNFGVGEPPCGFEHAL